MPKKTCGHRVKAKRIQCNKTTRDSSTDSLENYEDALDMDFRAPEISSALLLAKEIQDVRKMRPKPITTNMVKYSNVNFLPNEKIYHGLVDIDYIGNDKNPLARKKSQPAFLNSIKKDRVPDFKGILQYELEPEFFFSKSAAPNVQRNILEFDGHNIYNHCKLWSNDASKWSL